ncbi:polygalacturonase-1 non-catalytic subunit beta-like [Salvia miltiorrhiza]|uniref:polygalacturonase-1 non-catalytic subunit beta-like n=1 Tax=Salvia miltiorrhiza TaxID=226208 RepID=UPI0025ACA71F|nr:polygalacturonase-1 non-catalytic subunit beta-like [Salvia miltiorrhiza]
MHSSAAPPLLCRLGLLLLLQSLPPLNVATAAAAAAGENPFTPKSYVIRYWKNHISNDLPKPSFLLDKASPLTAAEFAAFSKLAGDPISLSARLRDFCLRANLFCFPDSPPPSVQKYSDNVNFTSYVGMNFTNYGGDRIGSADSFVSYSDETNLATDNFRRYGRDSAAHTEAFASYGTDVNRPDHSFAGYGGGATGGGGKFTNYQADVNMPSLRFTAYSDSGNGRAQAFAEYSKNANSGSEGFTSYGKNGNGAANEFRNYGKNANVMASEFENYGRTGNGGRDEFASYGHDGNQPENNFNSYGNGGNGGGESFTSYRNESNVGVDDFRSYGKKSNAAEADFKLYGRSGGSTSFAGYGKDASSQKTNFKVYGVNTTFKTYNKEGVAFATYANESKGDVAASLRASKGKRVNKPAAIEPGKFFREEMLRSGGVMPMPDIRDQFPRRSFLPRAVVSKLPFSTHAVGRLENIFHAGNGSSMASILVNSLSECERAPSSGETKRCVGSIEDMIDFSVSVLGRNVTVRTTENTRGSNGNIMLGKVEGINGGKITKSVSCHQSLFPYLLYYCHSVPKVRVYEADILDPKSKFKINHGVAICHMDTSSWDPDHGAFVALGSEPGKIEVCHWIFENDMTWNIAD